MSLPTLSQVQDAVDFLNAYEQAFDSGGTGPRVPSSGNPIAVVLGALGYYNGPLTGKPDQSVGSPLTVAYYNFRNDYLGEKNNSGSLAFTSRGGPPAIYGALQKGIQAALAAVHGSSGDGTGTPMHGGSGRTGKNNPAYTGSDQTYIVKSGDTLGDIANSLGVSLSDLENENPQISNFDLIFPGDVIGVPGTGGGTAPGAGGASGGGISKTALIGGGLLLAAAAVVVMKK